MNSRTLYDVQEILHSVVVGLDSLLVIPGLILLRGFGGNRYGFLGWRDQISEKEGEREGKRTRKRKF